MRLINANELKQWLNGYLESDNLSPTYVRTLIDSRPTIKAIPIEWIKKQIEEWKNWGPEGLSDDEWEYGTCLETLLENWEKENEVR